MNDSKQMLTRYLLGELSEAEQAALEERYFADPRLFDEVTDAENALVDDYARDRLAPETRRRFEQHYLAHPQRRERAKFAEALATRLDQAAGPRGASEGQLFATMAGWRTWLDALGGPRPALGFALASLLIVSAGVWLIESGRSRQESAQTEAGRAEQERRERELPAQAAAEKARGEQTAAESAKRGDQPTPQTSPAPQERGAPSLVVLALAVGPGVRGTDTGPPATLVIPRGTEEVRLQLSLGEHDYPMYRVVIRAVGGDEILRRADLKPSTDRSGTTLTLAMPASSFSTGDYMLTFQGATRGGEFEDLSQAIFQVQRVR